MCLNLGPTPRHQQKVPALPPSHKPTQSLINAASSKVLLHPAWARQQQQLLAANVRQELQSRKCQELSHEAGNLPQVLLPARGRPHQPHSSAGGGLGIRVRKSQGLASGFHCRAGNYLEYFFVCYFLTLFFFSP